MKHWKLVLALSATTALAACGAPQSAQIKDSYAFYLAPANSHFGQPNGTLDRSGYLNVMYNGETFTGRNGNNKIEAKGNRGNTLSCAYSMPGSEGIGSCQYSGGPTLKMKFN